MRRGKERGKEVGTAWERERLRRGVRKGMEGRRGKGRVRRDVRRGK